jgi:hypothetical protein
MSESEKVRVKRKGHKVIVETKPENKYSRHQGSKEKARRLKQMEKA